MPRAPQAERWGIGPQLRADLLDRMPGCFDDPAAPTGSPPPPGVPGHGLRLLCVSVRGGHGYLVGDLTVHPVGLEPAAVPAAVGTRFADLDQITHYVATEPRGLSVIWQVRVIDDDGAVVMYGFRTGPSERWIWGRRPHPPGQPPPQPGHSAG